MNAFISVLERCEHVNSKSVLRRGALSIVQVNMGDLCNQACRHCHIGASPHGTRIMSKSIIDAVIDFLKRYRRNQLILDITGGAPEMNPHFEYFIAAARPVTKEIIVRSNLTVLSEPDRKHLPSFLKKHHVHLICSLPCYNESNVDTQRGKGVFQKSIDTLRDLNALGYGKEDGLSLDVVYNPQGANLPPCQEALEHQYKQNLGTRGIEFNRLITITNVPIKRFKHYLESCGQYEQYMDLLRKNFNCDTVENIMCRTFLSVGYDGKLYDCDFNQALGYALQDERGAFLTIKELNAADLDGRQIMVGEHCFACTAGTGSSCQGAITSPRETSGETRAHQNIKDYYGKILKTQKDLKTNACCSTDSFPPYQKEILPRIAPEILDKFYGCGSPIPYALTGRAVLDLGSGTGRDVYLASYLVGANGNVIGVDMTDEQLDVARKYQDIQAEKFGFSRSNVEFKKGYIEDLAAIGIADNSIDVVISNCVINLSPDKQRVFAEIFRVLKPGGELYFSDVFSGRRIPVSLQNDPVLHGECLGGAMYIEDFRRLLQNTGCNDFRIISSRPVSLNNRELEEKAGMIDFYSMTIRAFNLPLEDRCEDYGQTAVYRGTIKDTPHRFILDDHHTFITGKPMLVCGNTAMMLEATRLKNHFTVTGQRSVHFGLFECSPQAEKGHQENYSGGSACC